MTMAQHVRPQQQQRHINTSSNIGGGRGRAREARPPAPQVYTRGTTGIVQTHQQQQQHQQQQRTRSRSHTPVGKQQASTQSRYRTSSNNARRYYTDGVYVKTSINDAYSAEETVNSAGSGYYPPSKSKKDYSTPLSTNSKKSKEFRDVSPARSQDSQKLHVKTARRVIDDLNRAQGAERRIAAITTACEIFDHHDEAKHNIELHNGAVFPLCKLLAQSNEQDEVRMICAALEMVFRASPRQVEWAYDKSHKNLMPLLLRCLDRCETGAITHGEVSILNISKTILYLARCNELRPALGRQQGLLEMLTRVSTSNLNPECRLVRIKIIASLANCEDNKVILYEHPGLCDSILRIAHLDESEYARQHAGSALMDLSSISANQASMANDDKLLGTLVKMVLLEKSATTRELVITALQNLAFAKENRNRLVSFKNGIVLEALKKCLSSDTDAKARRRAAGVLTNLACDETAAKIGDHRGLLDTLALVSSKDENADVQTRASLALSKVASCITVQMECHETLLDALVVASLSTAPNNITAVFRVKARDPDNRESMARHSGVLDTLADVCVSAGSQAKDRDNALRAIMHLVNEAKNRKIMCNKTILDALVVGANYENDDLLEARDSAIRAMERLATEFTNRPIMARHSGLLMAVAKAVEREAHAEEDGQEAEHGFLAKPLLMSLLVAM